MNYEQLIELLKHIMENNSWQNLYENGCEKKHKCPKYVDFCLDTRFGDIWQITFRDCPGFSEGKTFRVETEDEIKAVYDWLNEIRN